MGNVSSINKEQGLIIGLTVGGVVLLIIIFIVIICCCCRKAERSCLKRSLNRMDRKYNKQKDDLTVDQQRRKQDLTQRHNEIRAKYGLNKNNENMNSDLQPPRDNIFSVENEQISLSLR